MKEQQFKDDLSLLCKKHETLVKIMKRKEVKEI